MNAPAALRSAWRALTTHLLRSVLTMLGIIIGVAAVITMIAVGAGAQQRVEAQIKGLGSNIMLVLPGAVTQGGVRLGAQTGQTLTEEDAREEGDYTLAEFRDLWRRSYGSWNPDELVTIIRFQVARVL